MTLGDHMSQPLPTTTTASTSNAAADLPLFNTVIVELTYVYTYISRDSTPY